MTEELKRCPFCNGAAAYWEGVLCIDCGARIAFKDGTVAEHTAAWNARVPSPEVTALVEAARALLNNRAERIGKKYGQPVGIELDDGEKGYIVHSDDCHALEIAIAPFTEKGK